jgi:Uma2 family endonuclease
MPFPKFKKSVFQAYTVEEYLEFERSSPERHEYIDGEIFLMAGESDEHGDISVNLTREISLQLKGKDCRVRVKDARVKSGGFTIKTQSMKGMFSYPDLVVVCGEIKYHDKRKDIITKPKVIIEVLSEATEVFDRNNKFTRYKMFNPTLTDYILVSQEKPMIEHYIRQDDNSWKVFTYIGLDKICRIDIIECELKLSEVYDRIKFSKKALKFLEEIASVE